jgi:hypothetical protein
MKISDIFNEILFEQAELKELFGVSFDARAWSPIINSQVKLAVSYLRQKKPIPDLTIRGREYPAQYKSFPVDMLHIYINMNYEDGAAYDEKQSGYDENKQYHIYLHFGPRANTSSINHELRHAYEDFMRASRGAPQMKNTKEGTYLFGGDFEEFLMNGRQYEPFWSLIYGLYVTSKIERSGYAETVYDNDDDRQVINTIRHIIKISKLSLDLSQSFKSEEYEHVWRTIKQNYRLPVMDKFTDKNKFIEWASNEIEYKGEKTIKKLLKVKFHSQQNKRKGAV